MQDDKPSQSRYFFGLLTKRQLKLFNAISLIILATMILLIAIPIFTPQFVDLELKIIIYTIEFAVLLIIIGLYAAGLWFLYSFSIPENVVKKTSTIPHMVSNISNMIGAGFFAISIERFVSNDYAFGIILLILSLLAAIIGTYAIRNDFLQYSYTFYPDALEKIAVKQQNEEKKHD